MAVVLKGAPFFSHLTEGGEKVTLSAPTWPISKSRETEVPSKNSLKLPLKIEFLLMMSSLVTIWRDPELEVDTVGLYIAY